MRSADVFTWIGVASFIAAFVVGRWWFVVGSALVVAVALTITASVEVGPVVVGLFFGGGVGLAMLAGFLLRLGANWGVEAAKEIYARRHRR